MRELGKDDVQAAVTGGSVLAAGGGGWVDHGYEMGDLAVRLGTPRLVSIDEVPDDALVITVTAIGAPAAPDWEMQPRDYLRAFELMQAAVDKPIVGTITAQNGSSTTLNGWIQSSMFGTLVLDAAGNGRAQPTGKMGSLGLVGRRDFQTVQCAAGGNRRLGKYMELTLRGTVDTTANTLRFACDQAGGFIATTRHPVPASYVREHAALGAITYALTLGEAMLAAQPRGASAVVDAVTAHTKGRVLGPGRVTRRQVVYGGGFDNGHLEIDGGGQPITVWLLNEYMAVEQGGERLATFPDLIATLSAETGLPVSVAQIQEGQQVYVLIADRTNIPLGAGVRQPEVYPEVEQIMGIELLRYAVR
jgi:uncharacterized protein